MNKILRSLQTQTKGERYSRAKDLKTLPFEQLIGSPITHELMLEEDQSKKEKGTALKATNEPEKLKMRTWLCSLETSNASLTKDYLKKRRIEE